MANDLISRKALIDDLRSAKGLGLIIAETIVRFLKKQPTVDAVEVVRCRDCKHLNVLNRKDLYAHCPKTNTVFLPFELDTRTHYCSLGERKDNEI